jgi:hypothetical protein
MGWASVAAVRLLLEPPVQVTDYWQLLIDSATATMDQYVGYPLEQQTYVEYYSGNGFSDLALDKRPVQAVAEIRMDPFGAWGQAAGQFDSTTILTAGTDYALVTDRSGTTSPAGLIRRLASSSLANGFLFGANPFGLTRGTLTPARRLAAWTPGEGNLKITYTAGYDPQNPPNDLVLACIQLVSWLRLTIKNGGLILTSESLGAYSYTKVIVPLIAAAFNALAAAGELGSTRQILSRYRELAA